MTKNSQWQTFWAVLISVVVIAAAWYINHNNNRIDAQANGLADEARAAIGEGSTPDDVRQWLQARDWHILTNPQGQWVTGYYDKNAGSQAKPEYLLVRGYKRLGLDDPIPGERWISLTFRFDPDQKFISMYLDRHAPQPASWKGEGAGG